MAVSQQKSGRLPAARGAGAPRSAQLGLLASVVLGGMLIPLNSTMIAVAQPQIMADMRVDAATSGWLVTTYLIIVAAVQPLAGKLGDRWGRRPLILGGFLWFGLASLGAALAPNFLALLLCRAQQAVAGALALPNGMALLRETAPDDQRGGRFGIVGGLVALAAALGPPLSGALVSGAGWRAIFSVNVLLVVPALLLGWCSIPAFRPAAGRSAAFDWLGAALLLAVLAAAAALCTQRGAAPAALLDEAAALAALAALFVRREAAHPEPVLKLQMFRSAPFAAANAAIALSNLAMYTLLLSLPILLAHRQGWSTLRTGLLLAALMAAMVLCTPLGGYAADRLGRRWPTVAGLALLTCGALILVWLGPGGGLAPLVAGLAVAGVGLGVSSAGLLATSVEAVPEQQAGVASGAFSTSRYLGSIVGSALLAWLLETGAPTLAGARPVFAMVAAAACGSALASLWLADWPLGPAAAPPEARPA